MTQPVAIFPEAFRKYQVPPSFTQPMAIGWVNDGGTWYFLNASGKMATGWVNVGGSWYYLAPSGAMLTGTQVINGRTYVFDANGVWVH